MLPHFIDFDEGSRASQYSHKEDWELLLKLDNWPPHVWSSDGIGYIYLITAKL